MLNICQYLCVIIIILSDFFMFVYYIIADNECRLYKPSHIALLRTPIVGFQPNVNPLPILPPPRVCPDFFCLAPPELENPSAILRTSPPHGRKQEFPTYQLSVLFPITKFRCKLEGFVIFS